VLSRLLLASQSAALGPRRQSPIEYQARLSAHPLSLGSQSLGSAPTSPNTRFVIFHAVFLIAPSRMTGLIPATPSSLEADVSI
jgi:hypothetical protein